MTFTHANFGLGLGIILSATLPLGAQLFPVESREPQFWDGAASIRLTQSGRMETTRHGRSKPVTTEQALGAGLQGPLHRMDYWDGAVWVSEGGQRGPLSVVQLFKAPGGKDRQLDAWLPKGLPEGKVARILALPNGLYLLVSTSDLFVRGTEVSPLAVARRDADGKLHMDRLLPVDLGEKMLEKAHLPEVRQTFFRMIYFNGMFVEAVRGQGHLLFPSHTFGRFLILDIRSLETRLVRLYPSFEDKAYLDGYDWTKLEHAVLRIQPTPDGAFVLASRSEQAVRYARRPEAAMGLGPITTRARGGEALQKELSEYHTQPRIVALKKTAAEEATLNYPEILWWEVQPKSGKVTALPTPPGAPPEVRSAEMIRQFRFHLDLNGQPKVYQ